LTLLYVPYSVSVVYVCVRGGVTILVCRYSCVGVSNKAQVALHGCTVTPHHLFGAVSVAKPQAHVRLSVYRISYRYIYYIILYYIILYIYLSIYIYI